MTTSTAHSRTRRIKPFARRPRAFTLIEIMVSATIGAMIMALVFTVVVTQAKLSTGIGNYADMNAQCRQALSLFDREMRTAQTLTTMTANKIEGVFVSGVTTGTLASQSPTYQKFTIAYTYNATNATLVRTVNGANPKVVLSNLHSFSFIYFNKNDGVLGSTAYADVKKILVTAVLRKSLDGNPAAGTGKINSDYLVSAMVTMRNRLVTG